MKLDKSEDRIGAAVRASAGAITPRRDEFLAARFGARLREIAANPDRVQIRINNMRLNARTKGTILAAAMKNGVRLMHACGARKLCSTCRVGIEAGSENLSPMTFKEKLSLRGHLAFGSRTRLACQARVSGPVEVHSIFPLCGNLPGE